MKKLILILLIWVHGLNALADPDNTLRIAFVASPAISTYEKSLIQEHAIVIEDAMDNVLNIQIPELQALTVELLAIHSIPGNIPAISGTLDGMLMDDTVIAAYDNDNATAQYVRAYRNQVDADIVILYADVTGINYCGGVSGNPGTFAKGIFNPSAQFGNRDLTDSESNYIAIVSKSCLNPVYKYVASGHELGHLFGMTHAKRVDDDPPDLDQGVITGNKANAYVNFFDARGTLVASPYLDVDPSKAVFAYQPSIYSNPDGIGLDGNATHNNREAARLTAASIAAYRPKLAGSPLPPTPANPTPVPGCYLSLPPAFMTAYPIEVCEPQYFGTSYRFDWVDFCSSATDHYQIWASENGGAYTLHWSTTVPYTVGIVRNHALVDVKVKACSSSTCTPMSSPAVTVSDQC